MATADSGPRRARTAIYQLAFSERAILRWGLLGLVGLGLRGIALWIDLPWLDRMGFWFAVPFAAILLVTLLVLAPYFWLRSRATPPE